VSAKSAGIRRRFRFPFLFSRAMSIAASLVVRPALCLRLLQAGLCASLLLAGLLGEPALALVGALGLAWRQEVNPCRIDVSGRGQIRLTVYQQTRPATLLPGCTVWPGLLLLHLAEQGGRRRWLAVLPDSAPADARRRLAVAVQALAEKA
jgi:hypothetical protein